MLSMLRKCLPVAAVLGVLLFLPASPTRAAGGISPIPCSTAEVIPSDPKLDPLPNAKTYYGKYEGGFYRFEVPDAWNGELALYMHGTTSAT